MLNSSDIDYLDKNSITTKFTEGGVCAFTGCRPFKLGITSENSEKCLFIKKELRKSIRAAVDDGFRNFISGMALGVDTWAAEAVLEIKEELAPKGICIKLFAAVPMKDQALLWKDEDKSRYFDILRRSDGVFAIYDTTPDEPRKAFFERNTYMLNNASRLIAVHNGAPGGTLTTINGAKARGMYADIIKVGRRG